MLWGRVTEQKKFLSGYITIEGRKFKILVFKNDFKKGDTAPDYNIYENG